MAKIRLVNMMFYGFHGTYEYERELGQKFYFDVEAVTKDDSVVEDDENNDGVHSTSIYAAFSSHESLGWSYCRCYSGRFYFLGRGYC